MLVTVGVPIFNEERTLVSSLDSITEAISEMNKPYELILCFNGTTDNGVKVAKEYSILNGCDLEIITSEKGKPSAVAEIFKNSKGDFFIFTDADARVDKFAFRKLIESYADKTMAVSGRPVPAYENSFIYKVINARMINGDAEVSYDYSMKTFLHGRLYSVKREILEHISEKFSNSIGDDTFITHFIYLNYGKDTISINKHANVSYHPVTSIGSWWKKWTRIWSDLDNLYELEPEFKSLKNEMTTRIDWSKVTKNELPYFVLERLLNISGKQIYNLSKNIVKYDWKRLNDTKDR